MPPSSHDGWLLIIDGLASATSVACVALSSLTLAQRLRVSGAARLVLASVVLSAGQIVLAVEVLSLFGMIGRLPLLAVHAIIGVAFVRAIPRLGGVWDSARGAWTRADVPLRLMLATTAGAALTLAPYSVLVPVRHDDSLTYHLPRAAMYLQQGSLDAFPTPDLRQTALPANAEMLTLWQMAISGRNFGTPLVQALCWLGAILAVYRLARDVGARMRPAIFAGLAFASLPGVVLQATTAQNDLTTAFFLLCTLVFARAGLARRCLGDLAIAGTAFGLALGTKATSILGVPAVALIVFAECLRARRLLRWEATRLALCCIVGVLCFGSYFYLQNLRRYGHPTGSAAFADLGAQPKVDLAVAWANLVRLAIRLSEPAGFIPPGTGPAVWLERTHAEFAGTLRAALHTKARLPQDFMRGMSPEHAGLPIEADITTFGPLFALAGLPLLLFVAVRRREDPAARALACGALCYLVGVATLLRYNVHLGRFLVGMVAMQAPLLALLYGEGRSCRLRWVRFTLAAVCCATLSLCVAVRAATPLARRALSARGADLARPDRPEAEAAAQLLGGLPSGQVALLSSMGGLVHPLFDGSLTRVVRILRADHAATPVALREADYVLIWGDAQQAILEGQPGDDEFPWFGRYDLRSTIEDLRSSAHAILDGSVYTPGGFHLFAKRPLSWTELGALPDLLPSNPPLSRDRWRGREFSLPVRLDATRPFLRVGGEVTWQATPTIEIRGPRRELLARLAPPVGAFEVRVPLRPLIASDSGLYTVLTFESSSSFEWKGRDRAWRSTQLALAE